MSDTTESNEQTITVTTHSTVTFTYTYTVGEDETEEEARERALKNAQHDASLALSETAHEFEWMEVEDPPNAISEGTLSE